MFFFFITMVPQFRFESIKHYCFICGFCYFELNQEEPYKPTSGSSTASSLQFDSVRTQALSMAFFFLGMGAKELIQLMGSVREN